MALSNISVAVILAVLVVACTSTRTPGHDHGVRGGIIDASVHTPGFTRVDSYVRRIHPELSSYKVTNVRKQVVAGTKWYIMYSTGPRMYDVEVLDQPWTRTMKILKFKQLDALR